MTISLMNKLETRALKFNSILVIEILRFDSLIERTLPTQKKKFLKKKTIKPCNKLCPKLLVDTQQIDLQILLSQMNEH